MRLIDADDAVKRLREAEKDMKVVSVVGCKAIDFAVVPQFVEAMPTIDAVPVVRCKDCQWLNAGKNIVEEWSWCCLLSRDVPEDHFCSYGERRSDA